MEPRWTSPEALLQYQETLFVVLIFILTASACLMTCTCLLLLWFERPAASPKLPAPDPPPAAASHPSSAPEEPVEVCASDL